MHFATVLENSACGLCVWKLTGPMWRVQATAAAVEEEAQDNDSETTPVPVFPPETHLDVQAPRTPAKRSQHPSKPASKPATQRLKYAYFLCTWISLLLVLSPRGVCMTAASAMS